MKVLSCCVDNLYQKDLDMLADNVRDRLNSGIIEIVSAKDNQASIVAIVTKNLTKQCSAAELLKDVAAFGRGGSRG